MMKTNILFILCITILLTGCYDSQQPETMLYSYGLGIDYKDGEYILYVQLINLAQAAKAESATGGNKDFSAEVAKVKGESLGDALFELYDASQRPIYWSNTSYIIMTERFLKEKGIGDVIEIFKRTPKTRYHMMMYATKDNDKLDEIFTISPLFNMSYANTNLTSPNQLIHQFNYIPVKDLRELLRILNEPPHQVIIPEIRLSEDIWANNEGDHPTRIFSSLVYYDREKFLLASPSLEEAEGVAWVLNKKGRSHITLKFNNEKTKQDEIISIIVTKIKTKIIPTLDNGKLKFFVKITGQGTLNELTQDITLDDLEKLAVKDVEDQVRKTYEDALKNDVDVYDLSYHLYTKHYNYWNKLQNKGKIPLDKDSIVVEAQIHLYNAGIKNFNKTIEK